MTENEINHWLAKDLNRFENLTTTVVSILKSLLNANGIDYLSVTGRTKSPENIHEKIHRKVYADPKKQLTDISGIRVILYFESQVERASKIIESAFIIDKENSYNRDIALSIDQIGYRSVHYVCDLGESRTVLPENSHLSGLHFEIQLRTVLQHAWAELAHDRNYIFSEKLPREIERDLFLYAGMLEIADKGLDTLSRRIDSYIKEIRARTTAKDYDIEINSVSLFEFVTSWSKENKFRLEPSSAKDKLSILVEELHDFGLKSIAELRQIIPSRFVEIANELAFSSTIFGLVRDWMIIHDYKRYRDKAWKNKWSAFGDDGDMVNNLRLLYERLVGEKETRRIFKTFDADLPRDFNQDDSEDEENG